ncbi:MAG: N,N-dimethylformamidase beta subunit family domain-containing protein [Gaiellaceae bacterium]
MTTSWLTSHTRLLRRGTMTVVLAGTLGLGAQTTGTDLLDGRDSSVRDSAKPSLAAAFPRESYRPGETANLRIFSRAAKDVRLQVFQSGPEHERMVANDTMNGAPVTAERRLGAVAAGRIIAVPLNPDWPSGVYFARLVAGDRVGYAPFVLRPARLGERNVAVVMPTQTWQAYNHRDDDGDGDEDTWYASGSTSRLGRPYLNRGVPFHYKNYDLPFLHWLAWTNHRVDYLSDADLGHLSGRILAANYSVVIFPGHHEYVTTNEYDAISQYRNRGGNLIFLSANNFFWKIERHGQVMHRIAQWRYLGRPEAGLIGTQYFHNDNGQSRGKFIVRTRIPWLFEGTGIEEGEPITSGGIEGDRVYSSSPPNVQIVAEIPNLFPGYGSANMTYYERSGAKVFAAGAFTLAGAIHEPKVRAMFENLWERLAGDTDTGRANNEAAERR